jgi:mono/diheme cytochrome c family protein
MRTAVLLALALAAGTAARAAEPQPGQPAPPGQALYARHCLSCHQADGYGVPNMQPAIKGGNWVKGDPKALALFVMTGGFDSAARKEGAESHNVMPAFRQLSDADLAGILTYIRAKFGEGAAAVEPATVAEVRASLPAE